MGAVKKCCYCIRYTVSERAITRQQSRRGKRSKWIGWIILGNSSTSRKNAKAKGWIWAPWDRWFRSNFSSWSGDFGYLWEIRGNMPTNVSGQVWFVNVVSSSRARTLPAALSSEIVDLAVCRYEISTIYFVMAAHFAWKYQEPKKLSSTCRLVFRNS